MDGQAEQEQETRTKARGQEEFDLKVSCFVCVFLLTGMLPFVFFLLSLNLFHDHNYHLLLFLFSHFPVFALFCLRLSPFFFLLFLLNSLYLLLVILPFVFSLLSSNLFHDLNTLLFLLLFIFLSIPFCLVLFLILLIHFLIHSFPPPPLPLPLPLLHRHHHLILHPHHPLLLLPPLVLFSLVVILILFKVLRV